jgi:hypothetical protein
MIGRVARDLVGPVRKVVSSMFEGVGRVTRREAEMRANEPTSVH